MDNILRCQSDFTRHLDLLRIYQVDETFVCYGAVPDGLPTAEQHCHTHQVDNASSSNPLSPCSLCPNTPGRPQFKEAGRYQTIFTLTLRSFAGRLASVSAQNMRGQMHRFSHAECKFRSHRRHSVQATGQRILLTHAYTECHVDDKQFDPCQAWSSFQFRLYFKAVRSSFFNDTSTRTTANTMSTDSAEFSDPPKASLMGIAAELRVKILGYLLASENNLSYVSREFERHKEGVWTGPTCDTCSDRSDYEHQCYECRYQEWLISVTESRKCNKGLDRDSNTLTYASANHDLQLTPSDPLCNGKAKNAHSNDEEQADDAEYRFCAQFTTPEYWDPQKSYHLSPQVLRVCKQLHAEGREILHHGKLAT